MTSRIGKVTQTYSSYWSIYPKARIRGLSLGPGYVNFTSFLILVNRNGCLCFEQAQFNLMQFKIKTEVYHVFTRIEQSYHSVHVHNFRS